MVYSNKFVACILIDGHVQEELANGTVKLPFGSEYHLRFRNKHSRRAVVKIYIDGENVSGGGYIIPANDHVDIKRHYDKDRAFKFVELSSPEAVDAGKNGPNPDKSKGLIEAHFYLEKEPVYHHYQGPPTPYKYIEEHHHHHHYPKPTVWPKPYPIWCGTDRSSFTMGDAVGGTHCEAQNSTVRPMGGIGGQSAFGSRRSLSRMKSVHAEPMKGRENYSCESIPTLRDGCTVEGGTTGQSFSSVYIDLEDSYTTLKIFLQGHEDLEIQNVSEPKKVRKTKKEIEDLEAENEKLRKELAELENQKLKDELDKKKATAKKPRKKTAKKKKAE
jgi:hypothetical protein